MWKAFGPPCAGWFFVAVLFWSLWVAKRRLLDGVLAMILILTVAVGLVLAGDLGRTICVVMPLSLMGVLNLARQRPGMLRIGLPAVAAANLLLPATHVITTFKAPIFSVYRELDSWQHPPSSLNPSRDEAIAQFQKLLETNPDDANAHNNLGAALVACGRVDEAIVEYRKALALNPREIKAYSNLGVALVQNGQLDEGIAQYRKALEIDPRLADLHYNLGNALRGAAPGRGDGRV